MTISDAPRRPPRTGQVVLPPAAAELAPSGRLRALQRLSDPELSELRLEEFLDELLVRVRDALEVDTVAILLLDEAGRTLEARAAKGIEEEVEQGVRIPLGQGFAGRIAAERVAIYIAEVAEADVVNPILRAKGVRSLLGLPLIVQGDLIGVLHVGSLNPRVFGERDLAVLQLAAARAAPGIERARLSSALEQERRIARILQRSLLPPRLPQIPGIATAARYLPASDEVGGDWYDVFALSGGRVGIAIGDVVGHGVRAAALMGQLRTVLHAYAVDEGGPARTLEKVDRYMASMSEAEMATVAYAELDQVTGVVRLGSAGHLAPVVVKLSGAQIVEMTPETPLGTFTYTRRSNYELTLAPQEILAFYTDGLIERPGTPLTESLVALTQALAGAQSAEEVCALAIERLVPMDGLRDDVAIVALQRAEVPEELSLHIPAEARQLAGSRQVMRQWLHHHGADWAAIQQVVLAVGEACTNAVEHAYSPAPAAFNLSAAVHDGQVRITVTDTGRWRAPRGADRGRGLKIMRAAMDDVTIRTDEDGTTVTMTRRLAG